MDFTHSQPQGFGDMVLEVFNDGAGNLRGKLLGLYTVLIAANLLAWCWAFIAFHDYPVLLGTAVASEN